MNWRMEFAKMVIPALALACACTSTSYEDEPAPVAGAGGSGGAGGKPAGAGGAGAGGAAGAAAKHPAVAITSPAVGAAITLGGDGLVPVAFAVADFTLKMPGTCGTERWCGHVHLKVDGEACNDTAAGRAYNAAGFASPISAKLALCPQAAGAHRIELELHKDDHSAVTDAALERVMAASTFPASQEAAPPPPAPTGPTLAISSPGDNGQVTMGMDRKVPIAFAATGFTLKQPGTCTPADGACGHVHLKVDGAACNDTAAGRAYNAAGVASPIQANLALCPNAAGSHSAVLELHADDHSAVQQGGQTVTATVQFTARDPY